MAADGGEAVNHPPSWVEYDACLLSHYHEVGINPTPGQLRTGAASTFLSEPYQQLAEACAQWRPEPLIEPNYVGVSDASDPLGIP